MTRALRTRTLTLAANQLTSGEGQADPFESAQCRQYPITREHDPWFPVGPQSPDDNEIHDYRIARQICHTCPVRRECLEAVLVEEAREPLAACEGMRGGFTPAERTALVASGWKPGDPLRPALACDDKAGTEEGWQRHKAAHQSACQSCITGHGRTESTHARRRAILSRREAASR